MSNISQTPGNITILKNIYENLLKDRHLKPYYIKDSIANKYFKLDLLPPQKVMLLFDFETEQPILWEESVLCQLGAEQNEKETPLINIALLNRAHPLRLICFYLVDDDNYPTRLGIRLYQGARAILNPLNITFKRIEDWAIYGLDDTNVDIRYTDINGLHQLAKISQHLPNIKCALTTYLESQFPIFKEIKENNAQLPLTWNEVLSNKNKATIFGKRQNIKVGKKANKRTFLANYSSEYIKRKNIFSQKEFQRFENWLSSGGLRENIPEGILKGNKKHVEGYNGFRTFMEELLIYYLQEVSLKNLKTKQADKELNQLLEDTVRMTIKLKKKENTFNLTSISGLTKFHDELLYEFNRKMTQKTNYTFKIHEEFLPLVQALRYKKKLKRLKTPLELLNEGKKMANCVGSYDDLVKAGRCIIYHYDSPETGKPYTIEIIIKQDKYYINQHYGKYNEKADAVDMKVISNLIEGVNTTLSEKNNLKQNKV